MRLFLERSDRDYSERQNKDLRGGRMWRAKAVLSVVMMGTIGNVSAGDRLQGGVIDQTPQASHPGNVFVRSPVPDASQVRMQEQQVKSQNEDRQKKLVNDTAKLYDLAGQLKEQVAKSDKNTLSVDVVKKAEEIERLARSVKEKMRG